MKNLTHKLLKTSVLVATLGLGQLAVAATPHTQDDGYRHVNQVTWDKTGANAFVPMAAADMPSQQANLVFIRPLDRDSLQTSANIGIDGRFQVSLQGGHYSQVLECAGQHVISVTTTGLKNNELADVKGQQVTLAPNQNHYFYVEVDDASGETQLRKITEQSALNVLGNKTQQTHQISRVVADCRQPVAVAAPVIQPVKVIPAPIVVAPVAVAPVAPPKVELNKPITLDVLFAFDSDNVQPIYGLRIQDVASFMAQYPDTVTRIEGHTDSVGPAAYNMKLSQNRADVVKDELVNQYGAASDRVSVVGYGETKPVATNSTAQGRQQNRRVMAIISQR